MTSVNLQLVDDELEFYNSDSDSYCKDVSDSTKKRQADTDLEEENAVPVKKRKMKSENMFVTYNSDDFIKEEPEWTMKCPFCNTLIPDHAQACDKYGNCESMNEPENSYEFEIENPSHQKQELEE